MYWVFVRGCLRPRHPTTKTSKAGFIQLRAGEPFWVDLADRFFILILNRTRNIYDINTMIEDRLEGDMQRMMSLFVSSSSGFTARLEWTIQVSGDGLSGFCDNGHLGL